jgi:hypothetical protein
MDDDDDYETLRAENIKKNQELLKELDLLAKPSAARNPTARTTKPKPKSRQPSKPKEPERIQPRRSSNRLAGVEADSETLRRRYEEEAEAIREAQDKARRARHEEHDLSFLLGGENVDEKVKSALTNTFMKIASRHPTLATEILEEARESKVKLENGDGKGHDRYDDLRSQLKQMQLRSVEKVTKARVYTMIMHPDIDQDLVFVGDKEGNIGVWDPVAKSEEAVDEEGDEVDASVVTGRTWNLQVHGKSPITCLRVDPVSADSLYSSSYDSTIRHQSLQSGSSNEIWAAQDDVLISIFDVLAPQSHPSAFLDTPSHGLDERSLWVADHRGGLSHHDLRQSSRKQTSSKRWQVCEKKVCMLVEMRKAELAHRMSFFLQ